LLHPNPQGLYGKSVLTAKIENHATEIDFSALLWLSGLCSVGAMG
jgi:hypothetical protein